MSPARVVLLGYREQLEQAAPGCPRRVAGSVWRGRCHSRETRTSYGRIDLIMVKNYTGPSFHNFIRMEQYILGHIVNLMCYRMHIDSNQIQILRSTNFMSGVGVSKAVHNMCQQAGRPAGGRSDSGQVTAPETPGTPRRPHLRNKPDMGLAPGHEKFGETYQSL